MMNRSRSKTLLCGALFALGFTLAPVHAQTFAVLHEFTSGHDGAFPSGGLVRDAAGNLYGMTSSGGDGTEGVVYKLDSARKETILLAFNNQNGATPATSPILDQAGNLYGIADEGTGGAGVLFKLSPQGDQTILHAFQGSTGRNARVPTGGIVMDAGGNIFGTTLFGGKGTCQFGCGSLYRVDPSGTLRVLYHFTGGADGSQPYGPLVFDAAGNLYGVAKSGGNLSCQEVPRTGCGTVYKFARNGTLTVLHTFQGGADGATPQAGGLFMDADGNLTGSVASGGNSEKGAIFRISRDGQYTILHSFAGPDGSAPNGGLVADPAGNLYGSTQNGGPVNLGTVFQLSPAGDLKVLHGFRGDFDGANPLSGVIRDEDGHLYGTAVKNFLLQQQTGTVFEITP